MISRLMKNGNINLPAEIRKDLKLKPGDRVSFIKTKSGYRIIPILEMHELIDASKYSKAVEFIEEIHEERKKMAEEGR